MFEGPGPRLFGLPPGCDFPQQLIAGIETRLAGAPPDAWARLRIIVNTQRMRRRLQELLVQGPARLLPRIQLISELGTEPGLPTLPPSAAPLRRKLDIARLVDGLLRQNPDLAPRAALFDLSDQLAQLLDEMQGEGVDPAALHALDVSHLSLHWERTRQFVTIAEAYLREIGDTSCDPEHRQRLMVQALCDLWQASPPQDPVILAGSTGSRGTMALLMRAVARLPQGAVVLPGFDFDQPSHVWQGLDDALTGEDHPQFRFARLTRALDLVPQDLPAWAQAAAPDPARNRLLSLALRPAPVTDQWLAEGPALGDLHAPTRALALIEAPTPRIEALAIALRLRLAAEKGQRAALITPDRVLTRQVSAALDRWGIRPDDSAGMPLHLSAPGRFLRQIAGLFGRALTGESLLALLKHPLTASGAERGAHLRWTRELELQLRRHGPAFPTGADLIHWAEVQKDAETRRPWAAWLADLLDPMPDIATQPLEMHIAAHLALAEGLSAGPDGDGTALWEAHAGQTAQGAMQRLQADAGAGFNLTISDYSNLISSYLSQFQTHAPEQTDARIMIWGTLEARVGGADLVILGGLNEGIWPAQPAADPWLNRQMRQRLGLLLPDRRIGLAAHDFQLAACAPKVVLSRAIRDSEAETVPARWLNRLTNLLGGLTQTNGPAALAQMRARGQHWVQMAQAIERPQAVTPPSPRPAPCPPSAARPDRLSVTRIQTLIRDPYAIYAAYVLKLRPLDPLLPEPDAPLRGIILHRVMEEFVKTGIDPAAPEAAEQLLQLARKVLTQEAPWPAARTLWLRRFARVVPIFLTGEIRRRTLADPVALEKRGSVTLQNGFRLVGEADRIDRRHTGGLVIYDYKTGKPPSPKTVDNFDKQLLLEAAMAERGGFDDLPPEPVVELAYIGLGAKPVIQQVAIGEGQIDHTWQDLERLISAYQQPGRGYAARRALFSRADRTDYDQLSRFGEWDEGMAPQIIKVGQ